MVGFIVLASLLLLPLALSDDLAPGRTLLIETVDEPEPETKHRNDENIKKQENKLPTEHISSNDNGNDYSLKWDKDGKKPANHFCAGFTNSDCFKVNNFSLT